MSALKLRADASGKQTIETLKAVSERITNLSGDTAGRTDDYVLHKYLAWAEEAERLLGNVLEPEDVTDIVHTRSYWLLRTSTGSEARLTRQILLEVASRERILSKAIEELEKQQKRWQRIGGELVVPDTSMFFWEDVPFEDIDWRQETEARHGVRLVLPLVVIGELDRLKRQDNNTTSKRARESIKWLVKTLPARPVAGAMVTLSQEFPPITLEVYVQDGPTPREDADGAIIAFAKQLGCIAEQDVTLITRDACMWLRAGHDDVKAKLFGS